MFNKEQIKNIYALTPMQRGMLHHALLEPESTAYHEQLILRLDGSLDFELLKQAWQEVIDRHDALRGRFLNSRVSNAVQVIPHHEPISLSLHRIKNATHFAGPDNLPAELEAFLANDRQQAFDLESSHPMRLDLFSNEAKQHWMVWHFHHILLDGWSIGIVLDQVLALYNAKVTGTPSQVLTACDYSQYQRWLSARDKTTALNYWKTYLSGFDGTGLLPLTDKLQTKTRAISTLDATAANRLRALAQIQRCSLHHVLLSIWALTVGRYLDRHDVIIPTVLAGRPDAIENIDSLAGLLINTAPMRISWQDNECFTDILQRVREHSLTAAEHQFISLAEIQEATGKLPIDHVLLVQGMPHQQVTGARCGDASVGWAGFRESIPYSLEVSLIPGNNEIDIVLCGTHQQAWLQALANTLTCLLTSAAANPHIRLGDIDVVNDRQHSTLLSWGNGGPAPTETTILQMFDVQLALSPDAPALICNDETISYRELDRRANQLAHTLLAGNSLSPDTPVALVSHRDTNLLVGLLAILRAGAAYVPVDPDFPADRVRLMCEASGCRHVLASPDLIATLPALPGARVLPLNEIDANAPDTPPNCIVTPDQLAYVIFTSGSTGTPKGTMLRHRNAAAFFACLPDTFGFSPKDRILAVTTVSFDIAGLELIGALTCGMTVVLASAEQAKDPEQLLELIERERVDTLQMTPTRLRLLLESANTATSSSTNAVLPSVRTLLVGGEALPQSLAEQLLTLQHMRVFNVYGPTETTIWSAFWLLSPGTVTIGHALPGESLFVLSTEHRLQPPGAIGEIAIGGAGVARGYLNDPLRTTERFVELPGIDGPIYLTGDLGRWRMDGSLEFLGRRDDQIKIRGMRIEIGEIEQHLRALPHVRDAAAAVKINNREESEIVAYLVGPQNDVDVAALHTHLAARLPAPMIPTHFVVLSELPQTPNGKTDRRALPAPTPIVSERATRSPNGIAETTITRIFSDVLGHAIGPDDDFFLQGGHSLKAIHAVGRINRELNGGYTLRDLYRIPTPAGLASSTASRIVPIVKAPEASSYPLSYAQQALWILDQMQPGYVGYNVPGAYLLTGELDVRAFSRAWMTLVERHESLRTVFRLIDSAPRQKIQSDMAFVIERHTETPENLSTRIAELTCRPFDLANGPLFRIALISIGAQRYVLLLVTHHIISDGWSDSLLIEDLAAAYGAAITGKDPQAALSNAPALRYRDFAVWQRGYLSSTQATTHRDYWRERLQNLPLLELPLDQSRGTALSRRGNRVDMQIDPSDAKSWLASVPPRARFATLAAATLTLLYLETGQTDLILGLPIANRDRPGLQDHVGLHLNTLPLRQNVRIDASLQTLRNECEKAIIDAMTHADYPFPKLVADLGIAAEPGRQPVFDAILIFHQQQVPLPRLEGVEVALFDQCSYTSRFDLDFEVWTSEDGVNGFIEYDADLFSAGRAADFNERWQAVLLAFAKQPSITPIELRRQIFFEPNETASFLARSLVLDEEF